MKAMFSIKTLTKYLLAMAVTLTSTLCSAETAEGAIFKGSKLKPCKGTNSQTWNKCTGRVEYDDGKTLLGEYLNGQLNGKGLAEFKDGVIYKGDFADNNFHGNGEIVYPSGFKIVGKFVDNQTNGFAVMTYKDGSRYEGNLTPGYKENGLGTIFLKNGRELGCRWENAKCAQFLPSPKVEYTMLFGCSDKYSQGIGVDRAQILLRELSEYGAEQYSRMIYGNGFETCSPISGRTLVGTGIDYQKIELRSINFETGKVYFIYQHSDTLAIGMTN